MDAASLVKALKKKGVLVLSVGKDAIRAVTHLDVDDHGIDYAIAAFRKILA